MNDVLHIVGNRPQFIKLAPVAEELKKNSKSQIIIHTGQHYDKNMSDVFFDELSIPAPNENLCVGSGTHAEVTGNAMIALERAIIQYNPKLVLVYGDTNSTLAGALACSKLNFPLGHIEAGTRSYDRKNPEEINRILTDHVSDFLFCPDKVSVDNLAREGITNNVFFSGDVMEDTFNRVNTSKAGLDILNRFGLKENQYYLMTWHRQENTDSAESIKRIIKLIERMDKTILCPLHPRTQSALKREHLWETFQKVKGLRWIEPVGYKEMVTLNRHSAGIICDSGGLTKEAFYAGKKCLFTLHLNIWPDLLQSGWVKKYTGNMEEDEKAIKWFINDEIPDSKPDFYGGGKAAQRIVEKLVNFL